jgi:hypothetical protein
MIFSTLWRFLLALLLLSCALAADAATETTPAAPDKASAALVKAAYLHKFASFVDWPPGSFARADTPLRIGVVGDAHVWEELSQLSRDRDRDGRPVEVRRLAPGDALGGFHIVYLRAPSLARMADLLAAVPEGVLTVADADGIHPRGSVMSFFLEEGRVRFGVSLEAASRQKLRLSSRLLAVARNVQGLLGAPSLMARVARALSLA